MCVRRSLLAGDYALGYASGDMAAHGIGITKEGDLNGFLISTFAKAAAIMGGPASTRAYSMCTSLRAGQPPANVAVRVYIDCGGSFFFGGGAWASA